jgi:hypothetical protein
MAAQKKPTKIAEEFEETLAAKAPESLTLARGGIRTANDLAGLMGALIEDLMEGTVFPELGNAVCAAAGILIEAMKVQYDYGKANNTTDRKNLILHTAEANSSSEA